MEVPNGNKHRGQLCFYEGLGTALLLISVNLGALGSRQAIDVTGLADPEQGMAALAGLADRAKELEKMKEEQIRQAVSQQITAVGYGIWTYILFLSPMCGGHVNPAVTLAVLIKCGRRDLAENAKSALAIMLSQFLGGFLGCLLVYVCINWDEPVQHSIAILGPGEAATYGRVFVAEMIGTFIFASLIISVKFHNGAKDGAVNCFLVGMCLYAVLFMVGGVSGGAINPAVGLC